MDIARGGGGTTCSAQDNGAGGYGIGQNGSDRRGLNYNSLRVVSEMIMWRLGLEVVRRAHAMYSRITGHSL